LYFKMLVTLEACLHAWKNYGSPGFAVMITPAVALLAGGTICQANRTAARTGGSSRQVPMN
jgi:hypothetical protein